MGVSGCGKSTVGSLLAEKIQVPFFDGDAFHPKSNIDKMSNGIPLNDDDRKPWLEILAELPLQHPDGCVIACSALKESYRKILCCNATMHVVYLHGDKETLSERLNRRAKETNHFMPTSLLESQLNTLEDPRSEPNTSTFNIKESPQSIVEQLVQQRNLHF
jgi:carbohydrate kinase (thermoresistant glucokinase family)